ncbi:oxidoreductase [Sedimentitalea sp. CY04]|uniref:Oxidoreductase n=1 Tax=Parasedimentitalea denitrificans TaxID=2211118 RepID=A0ABX0WC83_9RHOB|nr:SDR family oxidoreductase [Sedimentitalea sp. CY04]NIZ61801.1 oxidoreductase [Sedimentitalea sp. CY04]
MTKEKGQSATRVLVLGGYGFIGAQVMRALTQAGFDPCGMGRNLTTAARVLPDAKFIKADLRHMQAVGDWIDVLAGFDMVVNCAGVLQDSRHDDLAAVHHDAVAALGQAAKQLGVGVVQVSAVGADKSASTEFMRTKGRGDDALRAQGGRVWILRPGLVIGQAAYGGTALLRMLAAIPGFQPMSLGQVPVQSVALNDVAKVVVAAVGGRLPPGKYDLVEEQAHSLSQVVSETRKWLGFAPAQVTLTLPVWMLRPIGRLADLLGRLGWRSPLRSTAIKVLEEGIQGNPAALRKITGQELAPLSAIYARLPSGQEHRLAARMALMMPMAVAVLSLFWLISGGGGLWRIQDAASTLTQVGWSQWAAILVVMFWSAVDLCLGAAVLWRPWAARACLAMVAVSLVYMVSAAVLTPDLWLDPLGPMVKVIPSVVLSLITHQLLQSR